MLLITFLFFISVLEQPPTTQGCQLYSFGKPLLGAVGTQGDLMWSLNPPDFLPSQSTWVHPNSQLGDAVNYHNVAVPSPC